MITEVDSSLFVADIRDVETESLGEYGIDLVVGVCQDDRSDNVGCPYRHFPLSDGPPHRGARNPGRFVYELFEDAVDIVLDQWQRGSAVLVHCHAGQSRSVSVAAAAMAVDREVDIDTAFGLIRSHRNTQVSPDVQTFAERYVSENR